jgi:hypothetical protein
VAIVVSLESFDNPYLSPADPQEEQEGVDDNPEDH